MTEWINIPEDISLYQGYVYKILQKDTGRYYIGKKNYWKPIRRKPLKGFKRVRKCIVESDWRTYNSSNKEMQELIKANPDGYDKIILRNCKSKTEMAIYETYYQIQAYLYGDWNQLFNEVINLRIRIRKRDEKK